MTEKRLVLSVMVPYIGSVGVQATDLRSGAKRPPVVSCPALSCEGRGLTGYAGGSLFAYDIVYAHEHVLSQVRRVEWRRVVV